MATKRNGKNTGADGDRQQQSYAALVLHARDNVATAVNDLTAGSEVTTQWPDGQVQSVTVQEDIPFGHKFALETIAAEGEVRKYGERIGKARSEIAPGAHVHVHNVESERGRGDLVAEDEELAS